MADHMVGPPTHTVIVAGDRFQVARLQAAKIVTAMHDAGKGKTTVIGIPAPDTSNGHTIVRYFSVGPGIPVLVEGPQLPTSGRTG